MKIRKFLTVAVLAIVLALSGCSKGCSWMRRTGDQTVDADGNPVVLTQLPGEKKSGDFNIHPYDGPPPMLYGPFEVGKANVVNIRVINKIGQAVNGAKLVYDLKPAHGQVQHDACKTKFVREGIYNVSCTFDRPGDWDVSVTAQASNASGTLEYQVFVRDGGHDTAQPFESAH